MKLYVQALALCAATTPAFADVEFGFVEGAPKDRFFFTNTSSCDLDAFAIEIDLSQSIGRLIFDVSNVGAGVEVFQPFQVVSAVSRVVVEPDVKDGQSVIAISLDGLGAGERFGFSIDVDDTIGAREITVAGSEFAGSQVKLDGIDGRASVTLGNKPEAILDFNGC
ncbi:MAG: aggregation factor core [Pseudomonadota bacterium]